MFVGQVQVDSIRRINGSQLGDGPKDGSVLRRVAKVTLDQATKDQKPVRPKHVPEKLDFKNHEKFEGRWFVLVVIILYNLQTTARMFHRESNCILYETGFRLFFGYIKQLKGKKKTPASLGKKSTIKKIGTRKKINSHHRHRLVYTTNY